MRLPRRSLRIHPAFLLTAGLAAWTASPCAARAQPGRAPAQPKRLTADDGKGSVDTVGPGMLRLRLKGGEFWNVVPAPNAKVTVVGTASREMLQAGQFVSCSLELDEFGKVTIPVARVTFPGGGVPGVIAGGLGIAEPAAKRAPGKRPAGTYLVSGPIKSVEDDVITVQAGKDRFEVTVPADAELIVQTTNVALASPGDQIEVEGLYYRQGELQATTLSVTLANPVAPPSKNRGPRRPAKP